MASLAVAPTDTALSLLLATFGDLGIARDTSSTPPVSQLSLPSATVSGTNTIASHLATLIPQFSSIEYSDLEKAEIQQWLTLSAGPSPLPDSTLDALNDNLKFRTTLLGDKFSVADVVVYARVRNTVAKWGDEERTGVKGRPHVVRWVDFVQNSPALALQVPEDEKVRIDVDKVLFHAKTEDAPKKEKKPATSVTGAPGATVGDDSKKKKKGVASTTEALKDAGDKVKGAGEKVKDAVAGTAAAAATAAAGKKTEKKQKPKREPAPPKEEPVISPSKIDLRVGHILYCRPHPNADSLFVSTIAMGDDPSSAVITPASEIPDLPEEVKARFNPLPSVRTVCSGLNGLVPIEEMQNRKVVVVANLKPVAMRGIKSAAMVLAASPKPVPGADPSSHKKEFVELVLPPEGAEAGERVFFEGYQGSPEAQLNPKKKIFEQIQPGFKTLDDRTVAFDRAQAGWVGDAEKGKASGGPVAKLVTEKGGVCKAPTLVNAAIS